jgi:hypothetical protein
MVHARFIALASHPSPDYSAATIPSPESIIVQESIFSHIILISGIFRNSRKGMFIPYGCYYERVHTWLLPNRPVFNSQVPSISSPLMYEYFQ